MFSNHLDLPVAAMDELSLFHDTPPIFKWLGRHDCTHMLIGLSEDKEKKVDYWLDYLSPALRASSSENLAVDLRQKAQRIDRDDKGGPCFKEINSKTHTRIQMYSHCYEATVYLLQLHPVWQLTHAHTDNNTDHTYTLFNHYTFANIWKCLQLTHIIKHTIKTSFNHFSLCLL